MKWNAYNWNAYNWFYFPSSICTNIFGQNVTVLIGLYTYVLQHVWGTPAKQYMYIPWVPGYLKLDTLAMILWRVIIRIIVTHHLLHHLQTYRNSTQCLHLHVRVGPHDLCKTILWVSLCLVITRCIYALHPFCASGPCTVVNRHINGRLLCGMISLWSEMIHIFSCFMHRTTPPTRAFPRAQWQVKYTAETLTKHLDPTCRR